MDRPRRNAAENPVRDADAPETVLSPLEQLVNKRRGTRGSISLKGLKRAQKSDFYDRVAAFYLVLLERQPDATYLDAARQIATAFKLQFESDQHTSIKMSVSTRLRANKQLSDAVANMVPVNSRSGNAEDNADGKSNKRKGRVGRKAKDDDDIASNAASAPAEKHLKVYHGAPSYLHYQNHVKDHCGPVVQSIISGELSKTAAAKLYQENMATDNVTISRTTAFEHINKALQNGGKVVTPQKVGGTVLPPGLERRLAETVKIYRERKFPVFPEFVIGWAAEEIRGTELEELFPPDGKPTHGWFRGWLGRQNMLTGNLRPLEGTREDWFTPENLRDYFEVAKGVLLGAGVAIPNPDFDPDVAYSQEILITHPERISSYDETKVELDCTSGGKGKKERNIRDGVKDDGESLVTKSDKCVTAACGRLGDGRALPVYIVFASGEEWNPEFACDNASEICDRDGKPLLWRFTSNKKGSMNEDFCVDYMTEVLHPALGYPKPRETHPGQQGVIICDGVGTHIGHKVVETAIKLGMEIVLRVPHLSFALQGEDTVNFRVLKEEWRRNKAKAFTDLNASRKCHNVAHKPLDWAHFMPCFGPAHALAFTPERNMKGWAIEGTIPFTRRALWRKLGAPTPQGLASKGQSWSLSQNQSTATQLNTLTSALANQGRSTERTPGESTSGPARSTVPIPARAVPEKVMDAANLIANMPSNAFAAAAGTGNSVEAIARTQMMLAASKEMASFVKAMMEARDNNNNSDRITARNIFNLVGSATGPEGRELQRKKAEEKKAKDSTAAAKREAAKLKRATEVAKAVVSGGELLRRLEAEGPLIISGLSIQDCLSLIQHAEPSATVKKTTRKADAIAQVKELVTVKAAIDIYQQRRQAPPPPPSQEIPAPPPEREINSGRPSSGSVGSSRQPETSNRLTDDVTPDPATVAVTSA